MRTILQRKVEAEHTQRKLSCVGGAGGGREYIQKIQWPVRLILAARERTWRDLVGNSASKS
jgi:hypothetical protein